MPDKMLKFVDIDMQMPAKRTSNVRTEDFKEIYNRFVHDSTLVFPIGNSDHWSLKLGIKNEYETEPAVSEKLDTTYYSKMSFSWK